MKDPQIAMATGRNAYALTILLVFSGCAADRAPADVADVRGRITARRNILWNPAHQITHAGIAIAPSLPLLLWRACIRYQSKDSFGRPAEIVVIVGAPSDGKPLALSFENSHCAGLQYVPFPEIETGFTGPPHKMRL